MFYLCVCLLDVSSIETRRINASFISIYLQLISYGLDIRRGRANTTDDNHCQSLGYKYIPCAVVACVLQVWADGCIGTR